MTLDTFIREAACGGPGHDGYVYDTDVYCRDCGRRLIEQLAPTVALQVEDINDPLWLDSTTVPQPIFFGESDEPMFCVECGEYLYGPDVVDWWPMDDED